MISINCKERCLLYKYIDRCIIYKLYYWEIFNLIVLIVINIVSEVLFNNLVELFYLFIGLRIKSYKKFVVHFEFYYKYYKEL